MSFQYQNTLSTTHKRLKRGDYTVKPFNVNKLWDFTTDSTHIDYYKNYKIQTYRVLYPDNHLYPNHITPLSTSMYHEVFTTQSIDPKLLWYNLDSKFYFDNSREIYPLIDTNANTFTHLAESSSLVIFPRNVVGQGIHKRSFSVRNLSQTSSLDYLITDDGYGNLIDNTFNSDLFVDRKKLIMYVGFNDKYREKNFTYQKLDYVIDESDLKNWINIDDTKKISYSPGIETTDTFESSGYCAEMNGTYFQVMSPTNFNFSTTDNFAFSFWISIPSNQMSSSYDYNCLFNKNTKELVDTIDQYGKISTYETLVNANQYPFDIVLYNQNHSSPNSIGFRQSSNLQTVEVISSALTPDSWYHVVCQKTGSTYQIWLDGFEDASVTTLVKNNVRNNSRFYIAGNGVSENSFSGSLDEIRIYNTYLTPTQIQYLGDNSFDTGYAYQTSRIGNIFYKHGAVVVSDPRPKYKNALLGYSGNFDYNGILDGFYGKLRNSVRYYEYEIICKIGKGEFNMTQNPTIMKENDQTFRQMKDFVTGSFFNPYFTTIGLYDDKLQLLAVAKMGAPVEKRDDVDMNVIVRFDI